MNKYTSNSSKGCAVEINFFFAIVFFKNNYNWKAYFIIYELQKNKKEKFLYHPFTRPSGYWRPSFLPTPQSTPTLATLRG